jgi:sulfate/thiosulfate transport system substrate-binding protein
MYASPSRRDLLLSVAFPAAAVALALSCSACGGGEGRAHEPSATQTLTLGAYTTPREAFGRDILPAFESTWRARAGRAIAFEESYLGSGAQARAIAGGFEADVAALSLEPDVEALVAKGLVTHDWKSRAHGGMVTNSVVVIGVRAGNPKGITGWADLARDDVKVLTPSPRTSGGAMWNAAAVFGAAWRGEVPGRPAADSAVAEQFLRAVIGNVAIMDKGGRESMLTFEQGVGDAIITYENEVLAARASGQAVDYVIPESTLLIESPAVVVDAYADSHGTRELAEAFVAFLAAPEAQRAFARHGFRPADSAIAREYAGTFPTVKRPFTIRDLGGWPHVVQQLFAPGGVFDRASVPEGR